MNPDPVLTKLDPLEITALNQTSKDVSRSVKQNCSVDRSCGDALREEGLNKRSPVQCADGDDGLTGV